MRRLDIDTQDLSYLLPEQRIKLSPGLPRVLEPLLAKVKGRLGSFRKQSGKGQTSGKIDAPTTGARDKAVQDRYVCASNILKNIEKSYDPGKKVLEESRKLDRSISSLFLNEPRVNRVLHKAKVYGWAKDGAVHLTQEGVNPYVAIHEYTHIQRVSGGRLELFCNSRGEVFVTAPGGEHLSVREFASRARADMSYVQRACLVQEIRNNQRDGKSLKERACKKEVKQRKP